MGDRSIGRRQGGGKSRIVCQIIGRWIREKEKCKRRSDRMERRERGIDGERVGGGGKVETEGGRQQQEGDRSGRGLSKCEKT